MRVIYWNVHHNQSCWEAAAAWMGAPNMPFPQGLGPIGANAPYQPDAVILAEPKSPPGRIYNPDATRHSHHPPLVWPVGALHEGTPTPAPNISPWCIRKVEVQGGLGLEQEKMYVLWNNQTVDVTVNTTVLDYTLGRGVLPHGTRVPLPLIITPRAGGAALLLAAVHLASDGIEAFSCMTQWTNAVIEAAQHGGGPLFNIGIAIGDFNFPTNNVANWFTIVSPAGALTTLTPTGAFSSPYDKVLRSPLGPAPCTAGRVYGPGVVGLPSDLAPLPAGYRQFASDHVPMYLTC
ncbi:hypothetical protein [Variovorax sp. LjRoot178]|uniref:hypothetical protein n=1 Tax=Variovorax sp. LjRoot178 TaxID=3342277 RepID=UPI003ECC2C80